MGRRIKYSCDKDRQEAIKQSKTRYMLSTPWYCDACEQMYSLAGKHSHMRTKKHGDNCILKANEVTLNMMLNPQNQMY